MPAVYTCSTLSLSSMYTLLVATKKKQKCSKNILRELLCNRMLPCVLLFLGSFAYISIDTVLSVNISKSLLRRDNNNNNNNNNLFDALRIVGRMFCLY